MPAKADKEKQSDFLNNVLLPLIDMAKYGICSLYFLDASHFVMGGYAGRVWGKVCVWVKTASGRKRYNVLGALDFCFKKVETISNKTYITSTEVVEMFKIMPLSGCLIPETAVNSNVIIPINIIKPI